MQHRRRRRAFLPEFPPEQAVKYRNLALGEEITGRFGLPSARIADIPAELAQEVAIWVYSEDTEPVPPDVVATEFISVVRYRGSGHTIYVSTARFTPAALQIERFIIGDDRLSDGTPIGFTVACEVAGIRPQEVSSIPTSNSSTPNGVVFIRGNLIISVGSDLELDRVKQLADNVVLG